MPSDPLVLGFDTSAAHCAAALLSGDRVLVQRAEPMTRGQAERLLPLLEEMLAAAGVTWADLSLIGVGVGPGNFTGVRIAVAAARGLALGLAIPARGIPGFGAVRLHGGLPATAPVALPAPQAQVWLDDGAASPRLAALAEAAGLGATGMPAPEALAVAIARAALRGMGAAPPAPLYLRAADAAPAADPPPVMLDA